MISTSMAARGRRLCLLCAAVLVSLLNVDAATNGFVVPSFRGAPESATGFWEVFTVASGEPGNPPDRPGATTHAALKQLDANAFLTSSGNIYNLSTSSFALTDSGAGVLGTVALQIRTVGSELNYETISLTYTNDTGSHGLPPLFRYELDRAAGQGASVSSLWQWDLTGLGITHYAVTFEAAGPSLSFDSMTLDTSPQFTPAFPEQPFNLQGFPATLARWMYPFNSDPAHRPTASVFGSLGSAPDFDSRDAQFLLGWAVTNRVPAGQGATNYLIRRARVTLTIALGDQYVYSGTLKDYRSYFPTNDPRYQPSQDAGTTVELFGTGFRNGYTAATYPQDGPWGVLPDGGFHTNRVAYAAGFDTQGILVDVSNNVGDDGTNEIAAPFEVAPFAVGQSTNVAPGQLMPSGGQLVFDLNLSDPLIYGYLQQGLNDGTLSFTVTSLTSASLAGPPTYPNFHTIFSPLATSQQYPLLDIEGEVVRSGKDGDGDSLPDDWENFYLGSLAQVSGDDPDGDRLKNLDEFRAGTLPGSALSLLSASLQSQSNGMELRFQAAPGRPYDIQWTDDLNNPWHTLTNPPLVYSSEWLDKSGTNLVYPSPVYSAWRDTEAPGGRRFYRLRTP